MPTTMSFLTAAIVLTLAFATGAVAAPRSGDPQRAKPTLQDQRTLNLGVEAKERALPQQQFAREENRRGNRNARPNRGGGRDINRSNRRPGNARPNRPGGGANVNRPNRPGGGSNVNRPGRPGSGNVNRPGRPGGGNVNRPGRPGDGNVNRPGRPGGGNVNRPGGPGRPGWDGNRPGRPGWDNGRRPGWQNRPWNRPGWHGRGWGRPGWDRWPYRRWNRGGWLARDYWFASTLWLTNFIALGLAQPPSGAVWVQYGPDALLVDRNTGQILEVRQDVFE